MSMTSRVANRLLLAALGVVWLAVGAGIVLWALGVDLLMRLPVRVRDVVETTDVAIVAIVVAVIAALCWVLHVSRRGRGRTADAVRVDHVVLDQRVVRDALRLELGAHPDVLDSDVSVWRDPRGGRAWRAAVRVRQGARLAEVVDLATAAVRETQRRVGVTTPVVLQIESGLRGALSQTRRVD